MTYYKNGPKICIVILKYLFIYHNSQLWGNELEVHSSHNGMSKMIDSKTSKELKEKSNVHAVVLGVRLV